MSKEDNIEVLKNRIKLLEEENSRLKKQSVFFNTNLSTVKVPEHIKPIFDKAEEHVENYFKGIIVEPHQSKIEVNNQRYILLRAPSLSHDFFKSIVELYKDRGEDEAIRIGRNLLFDLAHVIGIEDARNFHEQMDLKDPIEKLSAGPVHFAYTGWAFVDILPESNPEPTENFFLKYNHPYSFEADSWIKSGTKSNHTVCCMNAGYSSGWCEESFGIKLTAVEISCRAKGDENCTFIMASPDKINLFLDAENKNKNMEYEVPLFFERKKVEERLNNSLQEKEILLKEVHHRVKNNLQIVISLLKLRADDKENKSYDDLVSEAMSRIQSMSLIHEMLYANNDLSNINLKKYCIELINKIDVAYNTEGKNVIKKININEDVSLKIDTMIPMGLLLNEIISNSFKHAFVKNEGEIVVNYSDKKISISDNGVGINSSKNSNNENSFGLNLINLLCEQLNAKCNVVSSINGTCYTIEYN